MLTEGQHFVMKQPSRKGKPNRIKVDYTLKDVYKLHYKKAIQPELQLTEKEFMRMCREYNQLVMNAIVLESETLSMGKVGQLRVAKRPMEIAKNRIRVDWFNSKKTGKLVYHLNQHSNGYRYRWLWRKGNVTNKTMYSFTPVRKHIRHVPKAIKVYKKDYFI